MTDQSHTPDHLARIRELEVNALAALRAVAANPGGLRFTAHPSVMPLLLELKLIRFRDRGAPAWVLTDAGRRAVRELGRGDP